MRHLCAWGVRIYLADRVGQGAKLQSGPVLPTAVPSGQILASSVHFVTFFVICVLGVSFRITVSIIFSSRFLKVSCWGKGLVVLYGVRVNLRYLLLFFVIKTLYEFGDVSSDVDVYTV